MAEPSNRTSSINPSRRGGNPLPTSQCRGPRMRWSSFTNHAIVTTKVMSATRCGVRPTNFMGGQPYRFMVSLSDIPENGPSSTFFVLSFSAGIMSDHTFLESGQFLIELTNSGKKALFALATISTISHSRKGSLVAIDNITSRTAPLPIQAASASFKPEDGIGCLDTSLAPQACS